jgi:1,2-phenylacetyl-CoA epoxidase catalytic subunit
MRWKVKMMTNDEMRNQFFDLYVPKIQELGLVIPDEDLKKMKMVHGVILTLIGKNSNELSKVMVHVMKKDWRLEEWRKKEVDGLEKRF